MAFAERVKRGYGMAGAWFVISFRMNLLCFILGQSPPPSFSVGVVSMAAQKIVPCIGEVTCFNVCFLTWKVTFNFSHLG